MTADYISPYDTNGGNLPIRPLTPVMDLQSKWSKAQHTEIQTLQQILDGLQYRRDARSIYHPVTDFRNELIKDLGDQLMPISSSFSETSGYRRFTCTVGSALLAGMQPDLESSIRTLETRTATYGLIDIGHLEKFLGATRSLRGLADPIIEAAQQAGDSFIPVSPETQAAASEIFESRLPAPQPACLRAFWIGATIFTADPDYTDALIGNFDFQAEAA